MVSFITTIHQFEENGDKTGWTYIEIPADLAAQLQPGSRKAFRVKGFLDAYAFSGISLLPFGNGKLKNHPQIRKIFIYFYHFYKTLTAKVPDLTYKNKFHVNNLLTF